MYNTILELALAISICFYMCAVLYFVVTVLYTIIILSTINIITFVISH